MLQAPGYVGYKHLAGFGSYTLDGVDRPPWDEDERPGRRADLALADQEEKLSLEDVEQLVVTAVDVAGRPIPRGTRRFEEADRAPVSSLIALSVMASVPGIVRPSPGPRMMPSKAAPRSPCSADSFTSSAPLL